MKLTTCNLFRACTVGTLLGFLVTLVALFV